jgi:hypothetical protein
MSRTLTAGFDYPHPQNLKASPLSGRALSLTSDEFLCIHGRALENALKRAGITPKRAAMEMGYTDQTTVSRWCLGRERMQLDKLRLLGDDFFAELLIAFAETCARVEVRTGASIACSA